MWNQVKKAVTDSAREVCSSVRAGTKKTKCEWWNDEVKAIVERKEVSWTGMLRAKDKAVKEIRM